MDAGPYPPPLEPIDDEEDEGIKKHDPGFPYNLTLEDYNYLGPGTPLTEQYLLSHPPTNELDEIAMRHDLRYEEIAELYRTGKISRAMANEYIQDADTTMREAILRLGKSRWFGIGIDETSALVAMQGKRLLESVGIWEPARYAGLEKRKREVDLPNLRRRRAFSKYYGDLELLESEARAREYEKQRMDVDRGPVMRRMEDRRRKMEKQLVPLSRRKRHNITKFEYKDPEDVVMEEEVPVVDENDQEWKDEDWPVGGRGAFVPPPRPYFWSRRRYRRRKGKSGRKYLSVFYGGVV